MTHTSVALSPLRPYVEFKKEELSLAPKYACDLLSNLPGLLAKFIQHFIGNEQETNRNPISGPPKVEAVSSNIDDKTMHELYLWPFQDAVRAGSGNIMCSYNRVNNSYGCANSKTLNGLLKSELGFNGFVSLSIISPCCERSSC